MGNHSGPSAGVARPRHRPEANKIPVFHTALASDSRQHPAAKKRHGESPAVRQNSSTLPSSRVIGEGSSLRRLMQRIRVWLETKVSPQCVFFAYLGCIRAAILRPFSRSDARRVRDRLRHAYPRTYPTSIRRPDQTALAARGTPGARPATSPSSVPNPNTVEMPVFAGKQAQNVRSTS